VICGLRWTTHEYILFDPVPCLFAWTTFTYLSFFLLQDGLVCVLMDEQTDAHTLGTWASPNIMAPPRSFRHGYKPTSNNRIIIIIIIIHNHVRPTASQRSMMSFPTKKKEREREQGKGGKKNLDIELIWLLWGHACYGGAFLWMGMLT